MPRPEPDLAPGAGADPFPAYFEALEARHRSSLRFAEIRRGLLALSSLYVERRSRMAEGAALSGAGKRAAFALYYAPLHFLVVREIVRALAPVLGRPRSILDLGCGTGAAGAAWALAGDPRSRVLGVDTSGWAVAEARWTLDRLGLAGRVSRGDAVSALGAARDRSAVLAAFTVNELGETDRGRMLEGLLQAGREGRALLVVEPLSRRTSPWWPEWKAALLAAGGREDEWRFGHPLPPTLALLGKATGLRAQEQAARSLGLGPG